MGPPGCPDPTAPGLKKHFKQFSPGPCFSHPTGKCFRQQKEETWQSLPQTPFVMHLPPLPSTSISFIWGRGGEEVGPGDFWKKYHPQHHYQNSGGSRSPLPLPSHPKQCWGTGGQCTSGALPATAQGRRQQLCTAGAAHTPRARSSDKGGFSISVRKEQTEPRSSRGLLFMHLKKQMLEP